MKKEELRIKPFDLRLGNLVIENETGEYHQITFWGTLDNHKTFDLISPIPLSEEVLLKCPKVERLDNKIFSNYYRLHLKRNKYLIISDLGNPNLMVGVIEPEFDNESVIEDCVNIHNWDYEKEMFFHQLQNLFYALTGEELEVSL